MKNVCLGFVGLGYISQTVHIPCFFKNKSAKIIAICDHNKDILSSVSSKYGITKTYTSLSKMIRNEVLDAIVLVVQRPNTFSVSRKILKSNINLFVEKPMALKLKDAKELVKIQNKKNLKYVIGYMKRSDDAVNYLKKNYLSNFFGKLISVKYHSFIGRPKPLRNDFVKHKNITRWKKYSLNKKFLNKKKNFEKYLNIQCHSINLLRYLFGKIKLKKTLLSKYAEGSVFFETKNKVIIKLENRFLVNRTWDEYIEFKFINYHIKLILQNPFNPKSYSKIIIYNNKNKRQKIRIFKKWSFLNQSKNFINYIREKNSKILSSGKESLRDIELVEKIFKY